jgi:hypothetical protein
MNTSLQARIYDPLWMLTRQWQFGEFQGEDNGSPVLASWRGESAPLTRYHSGAVVPHTTVEASRYDSRRIPLETLVEREAVRPALNRSHLPEKLSLAAEAGQHFLRLLDSQPLSTESRNLYRAAFLREYSFQALTSAQRELLDGDSIAFFDLMAGRVPDGRRLYAGLGSTPGGEIVISPALNIAETDTAEVEKAARLWMRWFENLFSEPEMPNSSWSSERMEYSFSVGTSFSDGERVFTAQEYFEGHLDWYSFDANPEVKLGAAADRAFQKVARTAIPAPASFHGMPARRFWEFEDAQVNFGSLDAGPTDMLRLLLVEFALAYGNDWFVIPVELEIGCAYRTNSLIVTDSFGVQTALKSSAELAEPFSSWRMFRHSTWRGSGPDRPAANMFFLPPSLVKSVESRPIEEVLFLRDEMANMAWAVERLVESPADRPLNRFEANSNRKRKLEPVPTPGSAAAPEKLSYRLTTEVPDYWIPLLPVLTGNDLRLKRGAVLKTNGAQETVQPLGRILEASHELSLFEEEVPREGILVARNYHFARWIDGSSHLWVGRRKGVGYGEGSSGQRYDVVEPKNTF